jgi:hypothetical protein
VRLNRRRQQQHGGGNDQQFPHFRPLFSTMMAAFAAKTKRH